MPDDEIPDGVVFGYRHVNHPDVHRCPCQDPGNYLMMERQGGRDYLRCWCGRQAEITWDTPEERREFVAACTS